jgi:4-amino-4-deoxy-L-arabinose transferase-like glycosyltransferase
MTTEPGAPPTLPVAGRVFRALAITAASYALLAVSYVMLSRFRFPFELEWMEGGSLQHVRRVLAGQPLYTAPSLDWTPFIYTPLYWYVSAAVAKLLGVELFALRAVSIAATALTLWALYRSVRRDGSRVAGLISAGLFAATFRAAGAWFDLARPDMLACALAATAIWLLSCDRLTRSRAGLSGLLLAAALLSKQSWFIACVLILAAAGHRHRRQAVLVLPAFVVPLVVWWLAAHVASSGWSTFYTLELPRQHEWMPNWLWDFWLDDVVRSVGITSCLAVLSLFSLPRRDAIFFGLVCAGCMATAWSSRLHTGMYDNVLIPAYFALALLAGRFVAFVEQLERASLSAKTLSLLVSGGVVAQIVGLHYALENQKPSAADRTAGDAVVRAVAAVRGDVWSPCQGSYCAAAGKPCHAHWMALSDVLRARQASTSRALRAELEAAISGSRFAAVVLESDPTLMAEFAPRIEQHFPTRSSLPTRDALAPVTGYATRPATLARK